jgi:hypothetical protein
MIDQNGSKIVTKIMDADIGNTCIFPYSIPGVVNRVRGFVALVITPFPVLRTSSKKPGPEIRPVGMNCF